MSDAFLDRLAGPERQRVIRRLRSPEAYERLRERVKGPEDLERELDRANRIAELHFALASDPAAHERMKAVVERALREEGIEAVADRGLSPETVASLHEGRFRLVLAQDPETHDDALAIASEGNVHETIPVKTSLMDMCLSHLSRPA